MTTLLGRDCRLINAAICAYAITKNASGTLNIPTDTDGYSQVSFDPADPPTCFVDGDEAINAGYVATTTDNKLIVAFRGTLPPFKGDWHKWVADWLNDFKAGRVPWAVGSNAHYGMVEKGFAQSTLDLWTHGMQAEVSRRVKAHNPSEIWVTGHSKGAAMGPLGATLVHNDHSTIPLHTVVDAQPMTVDQTFKNNFTTDGLNATMVRYQNEYDLVPFLPEYFTWNTLGEKSSGHILGRRWTLEAMSPDEHAHRDAIEAEARKAVLGLHWAYVDIGTLKYIKHDCAIFEGHYGEARWEMIKAILELHRDFHLGAKVTIRPVGVVKRLFLNLEVNVRCAGADGI